MTENHEKHNSPGLRTIAQFIRIIRGFHGPGAVFLPGNKLPGPDVKTIEYSDSVEDFFRLQSDSFLAKNFVTVILSGCAVKLRVHRKVYQQKNQKEK
jgi:hypothetical protein